MRFKFAKLFTVLCLVASAHGVATAASPPQSKKLQLCLNILRAGAATQLLESQCNIKGGASMLALGTYEGAGCKGTVPEKTVLAERNRVADILQVEADKKGMTAFCADRERWYRNFEQSAADAK